MKVDNEYNKQSREVKRKHEKISKELQRQIDELGKQRLNFLHKKSGLLDKIFKRSETRLQEKTSSLQSKKSELGETNVLLNSELEKIRVDHAIERKRITEQQNKLRTKLAEQREDTHDDALAIRKRACEELQQAITAAVNRYLNHTA